jgi:hypothetical protein
MIPDRDVWTAALAIVKRYGDDAMLEATGGQKIDDQAEAAPPA